MNYFAFGDIHGQFFKLKALRKRLNIKPGDKLVFLGDYIDRGDMSFEVIELLIAYSEIYDCVFLKGNHEDMFMDYLSGINEDMFVFNGGRKTITSYELHGYDIHPYTDYTERQVPEKHMEFFRGLKKYYETEDFIFVHAGIHPTTPMERQPDEYLLWDRFFARAGQKYSGKTVVFGHTPDNHILNEKHKICIDTGACFESMGDLTAVKLPEREFTRQGHTMEDMDYENNGRAKKKDGESVQKIWENFSDISKGGWSI